MIFFFFTLLFLLLLLMSDLVKIKMIVPIINFEIVVILCESLSSGRKQQQCSAQQRSVLLQHPTARPS